MNVSLGNGWHSRKSLADDLERLGLREGDVVMAHAAMRSVGAVQGGVDALIDATLDVVGTRGTLVAYTDWNADYLELADEAGRVHPDLHEHVAPFDPARSRANRDNGVLPEWVRTHPAARRSGNPGASVAAIGRLADELTADHALVYGYGPEAPLGRLVAAGGSVLMIGAPWDTMTLLHHAEHLADLADKRVVSGVVPLLRGGITTWEEVEEFDTERPVVAGLDEDYFADIVTDFVETSDASTGPIGDAHGLLVDGRAVVQHAVAWLEAHAPRRRQPADNEHHHGREAPPAHANGS